MKRRDFLRLTAFLPLYAALPPVAEATHDAAWRTFELTYDIDLAAHPGAGQLWLPLPQDAGDYQRVLSIECSSAVPATLHWDDTYHAPIVRLAFDSEERSRTLTVKTRIATRDRHPPMPVLRPQGMQEAALYLKPTEHMPIDGIVRDTALRITRGLRGADAKARAIYEWVVDNTFRDPNTRGCGLGDIKFMLESGNLGGKCADINSLFVGLARAAGVPAREFYGVRVAESAQFKSLGKSGDISKAQHCRAEYFSPRRGWVAVDPADVRKAVLEEKLSLDDPRIVALRKRLFGYWEMNWVGFNHGRDFTLPQGDTVAYLMYPYARFGDKVIDGREPEALKFRLTSREIG
ncbi:transglutaminase-like domain-containing protein [Thiobacter aerophilum]|uniref:Transglutaminase family protein n=1 Tax=Thiobacter aerophilum TaxID=3121275 RepID=A0ABV0EHQ5_9BURK